MTRPLTPDTLVYGFSPASDPQVSPDGTRLAYVRSQTSRETQKTTNQIWLCGIDGSHPRQLTGSGERNGGPRWSPDGRWLAFSSDRGKGSAIYLLPMAESGEARELTRHAQLVGSLAWAPDGSRLAYTTAFDPDNPDEVEPPAGTPPKVRVVRRIDYKQDNRGFLNDVRTQVFVVDVATGERRRVTDEPFDHNSPQWSPDGQWLAMQVPNRNGLCSQLALVRVGTGETRRIGPEDGVVSVWAWSPTGDRVLFAGDTRQTWQTDFFLYHLADDSIQRLTDDLPCLPAAGFPTLVPPSQPTWLDDHRALFHAIRAGASGLYLLETVTGMVETVEAWTALHDMMSVDREQRYVAQMRSSLDAYGEIVVYDRETGTTRQITHDSEAVLREQPAATWKRFDVRREPYTIEAWLLLPPGCDPSKRYPVVLDVHGGPHGWYGYGFRPIQQCLATNDFLLVYCNPRGSGSYGREFTQQVSTDWGGEDALDLFAVLDEALALPYADSRRVGLYGYSYGGYMTARLTGQYPDRFQAAVCGAPVFDLESMYGTSDIGHIFNELELGGPPHARREWYAARSPSTNGHQIRTPTLIIHGEADDRCPIGQGEQLFVALKKAGCKVEFVRYPGGSHLFQTSGPPAHREDCLRRVLDWFKRYLGEAE